MWRACGLTVCTVCDGDVQGMRVVVNSLLLSLGAMANVVAMLLLVWLMFAILGVSLFKGAMVDCVVPSDFPPNTPFAGIRSPDGTAWVVEPCQETQNAVSHFDNVLEVCVMRCHGVQQQCAHVSRLVV